MSNEKLVIFEDPYSDKLEVDFLSGCHVYISIETGAIYSQPVQLAPKDVKKLRKQLKKWLVENGYKIDDKGE